MVPFNKGDEAFKPSLRESGFAAVGWGAVSIISVSLMLLILNWVSDLSNGMFHRRAANDEQLRGENNKILRVLCRTDEII